MIKFNKIILFLIISINIINNYIYANETTINSGNWFTYFGQFKLSDKIGIHTDLQFRMDQNIAYPNQNLLRLGLLYYLNNNFTIGFGYAFVKSHNLNIEMYPQENRIWQQMIFNYKFSDNINISNRLRIEQRFIDNLRKVNNENVKYEDFVDNRIRLFNRIIFNLSDKSIAENNSIIPYFALQNEVFINIPNKNYNSNYFDQNRIIMNLGLDYNKSTKLEIGYMNQYILSNTEKILIYNNLHFSIMTFMDLR